MNGIALILLGLYIIAVKYQGNDAKLLQDLAQEKKFVPWIAGIAVLVLIYQKVDNHIGGMLITITFIAMMLSQGTKVLKEIESFYEG